MSIDNGNQLRNVINNVEDIPDVDIKTNYNEVIDSFDNMNLKESLCRGMYNNGFEKPFYIQQRCIKPIIEGYDVIVQAHACSGKIGTFVIGILQRVDINFRTCQALVVVPTGEFAYQIHKDFMAIGDFLNVQCHVCIGETNVGADMARLEEAHIVVGTPGRIIDMLERNALIPSGISMLVLYEMFSRGLMEMIRDMLGYLSKEIQIILLSSIMPLEVLQVTQQFMKKNSIKILSKDKLNLEGVKQFYIRVEEEWKLDTLIDLYKTINVSKAILFCNTKSKVDFLVNNLGNRNFDVCALHSNMEYIELEKILQKFIGSYRILCTDLFQLKAIFMTSLIINYDLPDNKEIYVNRVCRRGKFGKKFVIINLVRTCDMLKIQNIEFYYNTKIVELPHNISDIL